MINYESALRDGLGLTILERLDPTNHIYKVEKDKRVLVARLSPCDERVSYYRDLAEEAQRLRIVHNAILAPLSREVARVPKLVDFQYGLSEFMFVLPERLRRKSKASLLVLLREYIEGKSLDKATLLTPEQTNSLRNTAYAIHQSGFCGLNLSCDNIVIQEGTRIPFLLDLFNSFQISQLDINASEETQAEDLEKIDNLGQG